MSMIINVKKAARDSNPTGAPDDVSKEPFQKILLVDRLVGLEQAIHALSSQSNYDNAMKASTAVSLAWFAHQVSYPRVKPPYAPFDVTQRISKCFDLLRQKLENVNPRNDHETQILESFRERVSEYKRSVYCPAR